jgi:hypothetical protein
MNEEYIQKYKKRVDNRAAYLATLTPKERRVRDDYICWIRYWRREYTALVKMIGANKRFIHQQGHNNLESLKLAMKRNEQMRLKARMMLFARQAAKVEHKRRTAA